MNVVRILTGVTLLVCGTASPAPAQILNTLTGFSRNADGVSGRADMSFAARGGNTEILSLAAGARIQWRSGPERVRFLFSGGRSTSRGRETAESLTAHLRHNRRLTRVFHTILFTQVQHDPFQRLNTRTLFGAGLRADLIDREDEVLSVGLTPMLEFEDLEGEGEIRGETRLSAFLTGDVRLTSTVTLGGTGFVQPRVEDVSDVRVSASGELEVDLGSGFSFRQTAVYQHDSDPPDRVERTDWTLRSGLGYRFGS